MVLGFTGSLIWC